MGWSCTEEAGKTLERWQKMCQESTGNVSLYVYKGNVFFQDVSLEETEDGSIFGTVWVLRDRETGYAMSEVDWRAKMPQHGTCGKWGHFKIRPDGTVAIYPQGHPFRDATTREPLK